MDPSRIPKDILRVLQDPELAPPQKMVAFNLLMPDLTVDSKHADAYDKNIITGLRIKRLIHAGKIRLGTFDTNFKLAIHDLSCS